MPFERYADAGFTNEEAEDLASGKRKLMTAEGCPQCVNGYKGRFGVLETMPISEEIKRVIIDGGSSIDIKNKAIEVGMITLRRVALFGALDGKTNLEEVVGSTLPDKSKTQQAQEMRKKKKEGVEVEEPA